jgi:hypothetical protein
LDGGGGDHKAGERNAIGDRRISSGKTCFQILGELGTENRGAIPANAPFSVRRLVTENNDITIIDLATGRGALAVVYPLNFIHFGCGPSLKVLIH